MKPVFCVTEGAYFPTPYSNSWLRIETYTKMCSTLTGLVMIKTYRYGKQSCRLFLFLGLFMQILWCLCWYHTCSKNFNLNNTVTDVYGFNGWKLKTLPCSACSRYLGLEKVKVNVGCLNGHFILGSKCGYFCLLIFSLDIVFLNEYLLCEGHAVVQLVEALHYKPEGQGFDSQLVSLEFLT